MSHTQFKIALRYIYALGFCLAVVSMGCGDGADRAPGPEEPQDIIAAWRGLMETPAENIDNPVLKQTAARIGQSSPEFVPEMIAELDDPALSNEKLIALVASLEEVVSPNTVPLLVSFTAPDKPNSVRRSAAHLLGLISSEEATAALTTLKDDPMETVMFTALLALTQGGDDSAREGLRAIYRRDDVMVSTRERIVNVLSDVPNVEDRALLEDAVQTDGYEQNTYLVAVAALGRVGTPESMNAVNVRKAHPDCSEAVGQMCDNTLAAIEERSKSAAKNSN